MNDLAVCIALVSTKLFFNKKHLIRKINEG